MKHLLLIGLVIIAGTAFISSKARAQPYKYACMQIERANNCDPAYEVGMGNYVCRDDNGKLRYHAGFISCGKPQQNTFESKVACKNGWKVEGNCANITACQGCQSNADCKGSLQCITTIGPGGKAELIQVCDNPSLRSCSYFGSGGSNTPSRPTPSSRRVPPAAPVRSPITSEPRPAPLSVLQISLWNFLRAVLSIFN